MGPCSIGKALKAIANGIRKICKEMSQSIHYRNDHTQIKPKLLKMTNKRGERRQKKQTRPALS